MSGVLGSVQCPLIIGHYGGSNTGDEAMLAGLLEAMGPEVRQHATVVVKAGTLEKACPNLGVVSVPAKLSSVLRALLRSDILLLGGGTHFHDDYTTFRYLRHFRYMSRFVILSIMAKLLRRKVAWLGMGFGPFYHWPTRWLTRLGLAFCDCVTVRDMKSFQEVAAWVPAGKLTQAFDLSALLVSNGNGNIIRTAKGSQDYRMLGISVTSVRNSRTGGPSAGVVFWNRLTSALIETLRRNPALRTRVMVIRGGDRENDWQLSRKLHTAISRAHPGRSELVPYHPDPKVTLRSIGECDAFIATRYHAGVLAYLSRRPLLLIAYHRKVRDLAGEIGLPDEACVSIAEGGTEDLFVERIGRMLEGDGVFRAQLSVPVAAQRAWLNIRALQAVLPGLNWAVSEYAFDRVAQGPESQCARRMRIASEPRHFRLIPPRGSDPTAS